MNVFISHSSADKAFAQRLADALRARSIDVWSATDIRPGDDFSQAITDAISKADAVIPVISRTSAESPAVAAEIALAVANRIEGSRKRIVPVLADRSADAPFFLRDLQWVDLSDSLKFNENLEKVISGLPLGEPFSPNRVEGFKMRGEWIRVQRDVLEAEVKALEVSHARQSRYITLILAAVQIVGVVGIITFSGLRYFVDSFWVSLIATTLSFLAGAFASFSFMQRAMKPRSRDDE